ncbi:hypothetical protein ACU8KH_01536 [Lachancea thermotolerans]
MKFYHYYNYESVFRDRTCSVECNATFITKYKVSPDRLSEHYHDIDQTARHTS